MNYNLSILLKLLAFPGVPATNNPPQRPIDWIRSMPSEIVTVPGTQPLTIPPGATQSIFSGVVTTGVNTGTTFNLTLSPLNPSRYRFTWDGVSSPAPVFRTDRNLNLVGEPVTIVVNANSTLSVSIPGASSNTFAAVMPGDTVFIPGPATGDVATVFSPLNQGFWLVLAASTYALTLSPMQGVAFAGSNETQTPATAAQFDAFGPVGVQVGNGVNINNSFAPIVQQTYTVIAVTPTWFEVLSGVPLPSQSGIVISSATDMVFYTSAKAFLYIETDQPGVVQINGDASGLQTIQPFAVGDASQPGIFMKTGAVWSLALVNKSAFIMNVTVISAG